jgi:Fic family protein
MIKYLFPTDWIKYDSNRIIENLTKARSAVLSLINIPYQRSWVDRLQMMQLKREVAGTSRIEGADFTDKELEAAMSETPEQLFTRSQKQAKAATSTYRWIQELPRDRPIDANLIFTIHKLLITGADDDHCPPGALRSNGENVQFGSPLHRGAEGGEECERAFNELCRALNQEFKGHNELVQALAFHYHFAAMHPFHDGNGRTARALEALMLQRIGLRDSLFITMSNYYYEEKANYLNTLAAVRAQSHDLTEFLIFGLKGIELQCNKLFEEIKKNVLKALFTNIMHDLFNRMKNKRKSIIAKRQIVLLELLLEKERYELSKIVKETSSAYREMKSPYPALIRDLNGLIGLGAIFANKIEKTEDYLINIKLEWPTKITESDFFKSIKNMPKRKTLAI